jgi:hypothetical protein
LQKFTIFLSIINLYIYMVSFVQGSCLLRTVPQFIRLILEKNAVDLIIYMNDFFFTNPAQTLFDQLKIDDVMKHVILVQWDQLSVLCW